MIGRATMKAGTAIIKSSARTATRDASEGESVSNG